MAFAGFNDSRDEHKVPTSLLGPKNFHFKSQVLVCEKGRKSLWVRGDCYQKSELSKACVVWENRGQRSMFLTSTM